MTLNRLTLLATAAAAVLPTGCTGLRSAARSSAPTDDAKPAGKSLRRLFDQKSVGRAADAAADAPQIPPPPPDSVPTSDKSRTSRSTPSAKKTDAPESNGEVVQAGAVMPPPGPPNPPSVDDPALPAGVPVSGNPQVRATPTVGGAVMNLAPWETPADRVVEVSRRADEAAAQNEALKAKLRELEAAAMAREAAIAETVRQVGTATGDMVRAQTELAVARSELAAQRARLQEIEKEDVETLKGVIASLEKLLLAPPAPPAANRREP